MPLEVAKHWQSLFSETPADLLDKASHAMLGLQSSVVCPRSVHGHSWLPYGGVGTVRGHNN